MGICGFSWVSSASNTLNGHYGEYFIYAKFCRKGQVALKQSVQLEMSEQMSEVDKVSVTKSWVRQQFLS